MSTARCAALAGILAPADLLMQPSAVCMFEASARDTQSTGPQGHGTPLRWSSRRAEETLPCQGDKRGAHASSWGLPCMHARPGVSRSPGGAVSSRSISSETREARFAHAESWPACRCLDLMGVGCGSRDPVVLEHRFL